MAGVGFIAVLALGICATLLLYAAIRSETSDPVIVDRETAERRAMERGGRDDAGSADSADAPRGERGGDGDGWGDRRDGR